MPLYPILASATRPDATAGGRVSGAGQPGCGPRLPGAAAFFPQDWKGACRLDETVRKVYMIRKSMIRSGDSTWSDHTPGDPHQARFRMSETVRRLFTTACHGLAVTPNLAMLFFHSNWSTQCPPAMPVC